MGCSLGILDGIMAGTEAATTKRPGGEGEMQIQPKRRCRMQWHYIGTFAKADDLKSQNVGNRSLYMLYSPESRAKKKHFGRWFVLPETANISETREAQL